METLLQLHVHGLHPRAVHFPIALFISAFGLELLALLLKKDSLHRTAVHIYILASALTPFVVWSGLSEAAHLHLSHPILRLHQSFALFTMSVSLISLPILWLINQRSVKVFRVVFLMFLTCIAVSVTITGHYGGRMVYEYRVGVEE